MQENISYIDLKKIAGTDLISREHGKRIRKLIEIFLKPKDKIVIDFGNKTIASVSFFDEAIAKLFEKHDLKEIQGKLDLKHITDFDKALVNSLSSARLKEKRAEQRKALKLTKSANSR